MDTPDVPELTFNMALIWCMLIWAFAYVTGKLLNQRDK